MCCISILKGLMTPRFDCIFALIYSFRFSLAVRENSKGFLYVYVNEMLNPCKPLVISWNCITFAVGSGGYLSSPGTEL